jgi:plasminogen activator
MFAKRKMLAALAMLAATGAANAATSTVTDASSVFQNSKFEAGIFTGYLAGTAREYVYNEGDKISQLNWRTDNAATLGFNLAYRPLDWLTLRGEAWGVVASSGTLTDYDWLGREAGINDWTNRSIGPLRRMTNTYGVDLNLAATFYRYGGLSLDAVGGVRYLNMQYEEHDSSYIYTNDGFRDTQGIMPGNNISYRQRWYSGYLGLAMRYDMDKFSFHGQVTGSPWAYGKDRDDHVRRGITYREQGQRTSMFGVQAGVDYRLAPHWALYSTLAYEKYAKAKADMHITTAAADTAYFPTGIAGLSNENWSLQVGAKFLF